MLWKLNSHRHEWIDHYPWINGIILGEQTVQYLSKILVDPFGYYGYINWYDSNLTFKFF